MDVQRGERLQQALTTRGIKKQYALAVEMNVDPSAITRWKAGAPISLSNLIALCQTLDVSADWLLLGRGTIGASK